MAWTVALWGRDGYGEVWERENLEDALEDVRVFVVTAQRLRAGILVSVRDPRGVLVHAEQTDQYEPLAMPGVPA